MRFVSVPVWTAFFGASLLLTSSLAGQVTATAQITADAGTTVRTIPSSLYGTNVEWIWNGDMIWNQSAQALDPQYVTLVKNLSPSLIRFPGGLFSDYYNWHNGMGPLAARPATPILPNGSLSLNNFGTAEALALASSTGSHLLITVNAGTGTAQLASDWVKYVNQTSGGPRVDYWEIGNELYLPPQIGSMTVVSMTAAQYASAVVAFSKAMKAVDPTIKVGAILPENFTQAPPSAWTQTVISTAANYIDFVAVHNGYAPVLQTTNQDVSTVYAGMLAAPALIRANLAAIAASIDQLAPQHAGQIGLAVTEWGPLFSTDLNHPFVDHVKTLGSGLFTASGLMALVTSPRAITANLFKLADPLFQGSIGLRAGAPAPTATYYALQMFTKHVGTTLIKSTTTSPVYSTQWVSGIPAQSAVPYLDAIVTLSADRKTCYVTVVNKNFGAGITAGINLKNVSPAGTATVWTLAGTAIDSNTGTSPFPGVYVAPQTEAKPASRFYYGNATEVQLTSHTLSGVAASLNYTFPAASVTSIQIPLN